MTNFQPRKNIHIGRDPQNDYVINDKNVSRNHAKLIIYNDTEYFLEDLNSSNGTFVNGVRIQQKKVKAGDFLSFARNGNSIELNDLIELISKIKSDNRSIAQNDYTAEFQKLEKIYTDYPSEQKNLKKIEKDVRFYSVVISSTIGVLAFVLSFFKSSGSSLFILVSGISSLGISILAPTLASRFLKTDEKLESLEKNYREKYRCPNPHCHHPFGNREWAYWAKKRNCPSCKTVWVK